jgi:ABC-2 type transport system ATP-binding protein
MYALEISNLTKTYDSKVQALNSISLNVKEGDFFALLGPNGAGKSTTIGIITTLVNKTSGQIKIFGHDLDKESNIAKSYIGLVPQEANFNIFETVLNVLIYQAGFYGVPANIAKQRAEHYLKALGLWDKHNQQVLNLSGGMKRRLLIARALIHQPKLLILDEPTAGIDIELRRTMWNFLREINAQGTTIILTTHYLEEAENLCKNIAIIDKGRIIENTSIKEVLTKLNIETIILYLTKPLHQAIDLANFNYRLQDDTTLEVDISKEHSLNDLFALLSQQSIEVTGMRNKANRLEELFLKLINSTPS